MRLIKIGDYQMFDIKARRTSAKPKITLAELAEEAGVDLSTISLIEIGKTKNPGFQTVRAIEEALGRLERGRMDGMDRMDRMDGVDRMDRNGAACEANGLDANRGNEKAA